jgi:hypothetical protein
MVIVWLVLVGYPFLRKDLGYLKETISTLSAKKVDVFIVITFALLTGCFFQMYFIFYLSRTFSFELTSLSSVLYLSMGVATIMATLCNARNYPSIHFWAAAYYFVIAPITMLCIGYKALSYNHTAFVVSLVLTVLYALGNGFFALKFKKVNATFEVYCFLVLSVWTLYMTFA